jgi:hypothetical protein
MKDAAGILAVGAILLTLMGGIAGTVFSTAVYRLKKKEHKETRIIDITLVILSIIFIVMILSPFVGILTYTNFTVNQMLFIYCLGIVFGVVGSILANFCMAAYDRGDWKGMLITGGILVVYIVYFLFLFSLFE